MENSHLCSPLGTITKAAHLLVSDTISIIKIFQIPLYPLLEGVCGQVGNLIHIFWTCKSCTSFWRKKFPILSEKTGVLTKPDPALAILHLGIDVYSLLEGVRTNGNLIHIFWTCKSLTSFWRKMFTIPSETTGVLTKPDPALAILHLGIDSFHHSIRTVVLHILVAAKTVIARHWTKNMAPSPSEAVDLINTVFI